MSGDCPRLAPSVVFRLSQCVYQLASVYLSAAVPPRAQLKSLPRSLPTLGLRRGSRIELVGFQIVFTRASALTLAFDICPAEYQSEDSNLGLPYPLLPFRAGLVW